MKKVVVITADPPVPITGGGSRTYYFTEALAKVASCNLFVLFPLDRDKLSRDFLSLFNSVLISKVSFRASCSNRLKTLVFYIKLILVPWLFSKHQLILNAHYFVSNSYKGTCLTGRLIYNLATYSSVYYSFFLYKLGYKIPVKSLERKEQYDELYNNILKDLEDTYLLWLDFSTLLPLFKNLLKSNRKFKVVVNAHNIEFLLLERLAEVAKTKLAKKWLRLQARILKREELQGLSCADLVIVCSDHDKKVIQKHTNGAIIEVIPNGVDLDFFRPNLEALPTSFPSILFTGTMGYYPNREAVQYFISDIFPLVKEALPTCKFIIAGANAKNVFTNYLNRDDIIVFSSPGDMRPIYNEAWLVVVPLKTGSGTRLKILEALAMGKPVISTTIGAEGLDLTEEEIVISDSALDFSSKVILLLNSYVIRNNLIDKGYNKVFNMYGWPKITYNLEMRLIKLIK